MKKMLGALVALVLLLVAAPWMLGQFAEARVNRGLDAMVARAPYLRMAERQWTQGWFRSRQQVVWEVAYPAGSPLIRFTVRNEVLHGPVLWAAGLGLARVDTHFVLEDGLRDRIIAIFGTPEPWQLRTRVAFFGGGTTVISGKARSIDLKKIDGRQDGILSWDDFRLSVAMSRKAKSFDIDGHQPRLEVRDDSGTHMVMSGITMEGSAERIVGDLYDSDMTFAAARLAVNGLQGQNVEVADLRYELDSDRDGEFIAYSTEAGTGAIDTEQLRSRNLQLKETHLDLTVRHLHIPTLEKLMAALNRASSAPDSAQDIQQAAAPMMEHGLELLRHDPELVIDRIGFATADGAGWIRGTIRLVGVTGQGFSFGIGSLQNLEADIRIEADQAMLEKFPGGATALGLALDQGMATREGNKLVSRIEFRDGRLTINGKSQRLPGTAAPGA